MNCLPWTLRILTPTSRQEFGEVQGSATVGTLAPQRARGVRRDEECELEKLPTVKINLLRKALNVYLDNMTVGFTTDNKALVKVKAKDEQKLLQTVGRASATPAAAGAPAADGSTPPAPAPGGGLTARGLAARALPPPPPAGTDGGMSAEMRQRYGLSGRGGGGAAGRAQPLAQPLAAAPVVQLKVVAKPPSTTLSPLMSTGEGSWTKTGDRPQLKIAKDDKEVVMDVSIKDNRF